MSLDASEVSAVTGMQRADLSESEAARNIAGKKIPVFTCEGPCVRGKIARLAADLVAQALPSCARAWHGESAHAPDSTLARWIAAAGKVVVIDGCFLKCDTGMLDALAGEDKLVHIVAFPLDHHYSHAFLYDVSDREIEVAARELADRILEVLKQGPAATLAADLPMNSAAELRCWWPGCDTVLSEDITALRADASPLEHDDSGYYIACPRCGARSYPPQALCCAIG